ncbi:FxSxx-COOH system tetratricopeptide repeat protein [Actinoplanes sp. NPDC049668]|uniref:FxSxx-COOH system tetratricopeptide repeat protein n=1 Tax=unclassified Actinoplanes TaxID=2626549 RepID=UPI0033B97FF5
MAEGWGGARMSADGSQENAWPSIIAGLDEPGMTEALARLRGPADGWEALIVVDDHPSMVVWRETIDRFIEIAGRSVGVTRVQHWHLTLPASGAGQVLVRAAEGGSAAQPPARLVDGGRRRLLLVLTDGSAPGWSASASAAAFQLWGRTHPVAIVHLLPQAMWRRTGLAGERLRILPVGTATANAFLAWRPLDAILNADDGPPTVARDEPGGMPVPLLELSPQWIEVWLRLITQPAGDHADLPCLLMAPPDAGSPDAEPPRSVQAAAFRAVASPQAFKLATFLAAAPLNVPVMRLIQAELLPDSRTEHLSEILVAGLIRPVPRDHAADASGLVTHEFPPRLRVELLANARRHETIRVVHTLDDFLGARVPAIRRLRAMVDDPTQPATVRLEPGELRLVEIQAVVLHALSGRHLPLARRIQGLVAQASGREAELNPTVKPYDPAEAGMSLIQEPGPADAPEPAPTVIATTRSSVRVPAVWGSVPPRNPNFTGRIELLGQLRESLTAEPTAVLPEALHGMGGVGKTQVVVEFVYRNAGDYDVVWWISAERPAQITASMVELATKLRLPVNAEAAAVPAVKEALRVGNPYAKWLLVFDNADVPDDVSPYFPLGGPGHIVVTSRNPLWEAVAKKVEVDVFRREESQALLARRAPALGPAETDALAAVLGDLPLAIEQAAAWLAETGMQAREYLTLFEEKKIELMDISPPSDYEFPVAAAWNVSLDHLARTRPAALRLLQLCALLAPEPISRTLLSAGNRMHVSPELASALRDPIQLGRAIREINRYALARVDHAKNTIQMHRLVQAVLVERMTPEERTAMRDSAHQLLAANNPQQPANRDEWPVYAELYPHLVASGAITDAEDDWVRDLVIGEAKYHVFWGNPTESLTICETAYAAWREKLGEDAPQTLEIGRWLAFVLFALGRYKEAATLNADLLTRHQRFADEYPEALLDAMQAVAADRRVEGRFQDALERSREVYDRCVSLYGDDEPFTLNAAHNLAVSLRLAGQFEAAREVDQNTWDRKVQIFGQSHEESLRAHRGVLIDRRQLGDYLASREEFERLTDSFVDSLGERDPQTVETNRSLSVTRRKAGDHRGALATSEDALKRYVAAFGEANPGTMSAALNLALDLRQAGDLDRAEALATENFQRFRDTLGKTHPHALAAGGNLAIILRLKNDVVQARELNEVTLARLRDGLGPDHVLTLSCATNLASDVYAAGEIETASRMDTEYLGRYRAALGLDHPSTLAAALNLAIDLRALGRADEAHALHDDTVERYQRVLGPDHPATKAALKWERANCDMDPMPL